MQSCGSLKTGTTKVMTLKPKHREEEKRRAEEEEGRRRRRRKKRAEKGREKSWVWCQGNENEILVGNGK